MCLPQLQKELTVGLGWTGEECACRYARNALAGMHQSGDWVPDNGADAPPPPKRR